MTNSNLVYSRKPSKFTWSSYQSDAKPSDKNIHFYLDNKGRYNPVLSEKRREFLKQQQAQRNKIPSTGEIISHIAEVFGKSKEAFNLKSVLY